jgi:hypothetical protein
LREEPKMCLTKAMATSIIFDFVAADDELEEVEEV